MQCYNDSDRKLCEYCQSCALLVDFSYNLHQEINKYINDGGNINDVESLQVETLIPIINQTCSNWAKNISDTDLEVKKNNLDVIQDSTLQDLIINLPYNQQKRIDFINKQVGLATIQITRNSWFQNVFTNIIKYL